MGASGQLTQRGILICIVLVLAGLILSPTPTVASPGLATQALSGGLAPADLASALVGTGITVSNVTYSGAPQAAGRFSGGSGIIGFDSGIILSSGSIANVVGPNKSDSISTDNGRDGDSQLSALSGFPTSDAAVLEFDFVPATNSVLFRYVFASDEYNEYVHSSYNDVFAFFVNGVNCATTPGTAQPVSINTINNGNPFGSNPKQNPGLFINNDLSDGGGSIDTEMDGLTTIMSCVASVTAGKTNHIKLAIADASDHIYDSNVFLETGSFKPQPPKPSVSERKILYVQGINSQSNCEDKNPPSGADGFGDRAPRWLQNYLQTQQWIKANVNVVGALYFSYTGSYCDGGNGENGAIPTYGHLDTCAAGIDEVYSDRLKGLIQRATDDGSKVSIVAHSQGGLIAAYLVARLRKDDPDFLRKRVASVVTFDSPLQGLPSAAIQAFAALGGGDCGLGMPVYDDWNSSSPVAQAARQAAQPFGTDNFQVAFYTIDAAGWGVPEGYTHLTGDWLRRQFPGDHSQIWDDSSTDKQEFVGCAVLRMKDCTFWKAPVSQGQMTQTQMAIGPDVKEFTLTSTVGSTVRMTLISPDGTVYGPDGAGPVLAYGVDDASETYIIGNPAPGEWTIQLFGVDIAPAGEDVLLALLVDEVSNQPPLLTVPGDQNVQYSDPLTFSVSATDPDPSDILTLTASGLPPDLTFVDNGDGTGAVSGTAQVAAGSYPVTFSVSDGVNPPVSAGLNIVVGKEDAAAAYTGDSLVRAGSPVKLEASVNEVADGSPGDITKAAVFFDVTAGIAGGTTSYGPVPVSASGEASWTVPTGFPADIYTVTVRMDPANGYYQAPAASAASLVAYGPSAGSTIGLGWVPDAGATGVFGFGASYLKGDNIWGAALYSYHTGRAVTVVSSASMQWLVVNGKTAVFRGKATVNGARNYTFEIRVVDNGQRGASDTFAIKIWRPDGTLLHEVSATKLAGGEVIVSRPKSH